MQCTSCHNPHNDQFGKFLVMGNSASALCNTCHLKNFWSQTTHRTSTRTWNGVAPNPWPHTAYTTVATNACENCHRPHTAGGHQRILNANAEEDNCYFCHNGNVAQKNVKNDFLKASTHPLASATGVHSPVEGAVPANRHVECVDCHNPHASNPTTATVPYASGRLAQLVGVSSSGTSVNPLVYEYELCFRCHGDSPGTSAPVVTRWITDKNMRSRFAVANASYHPVVATGKNPSGPSLIAPWTTSSRMYCSDCHNSDSGVKAGGAGPNGPHGSIYRPLLIKNLTYTDNTTESAAAYALCYRCHSRTSILNNQSFTEHNKHIVSVRTPCTVCHDPHGVTTNPRLINFDKTVVFASSSGRLSYTNTGTNRGTCYLRCHNEDHNPLSY
jgi:predicted CXXCH cytochrome family protein